MSTSPRPVDDSGDSSGSDSEVGEVVPQPLASTKCPYLPTCRRALLDFDLDKRCSVTLSPHHVYACCVCGKYFSGRGQRTPAYMHALQAGHAVFLSLDSGRVYCLPDGYEVLDASLTDIKQALRPVFTRERIAELDASSTLSTDVSGVNYLPGYVGLNNLKHTDAINVVVQALAHVTPLRDYFLLEENYAGVPSQLVQRFGQLMRKLWSPWAFKATVTPIEFVHEVTASSGGKFGVARAVEASDFLTWLLNTLHRDLTAPDVGALATARAAAATAASTAAVSGQKRRRPGAVDAKASVVPHAPARSIITDVFQGEIEVTTLSEEGGAAGEVRTSPFLLLSLDLPPAPLFKDSQGSNVIPQIPIYALLSKYDGVTVSTTLRGQVRSRRTFRIRRLPPYVIFTLKRFAVNGFFAEKNLTLINLPVKHLDMRAYCAPSASGGMSPPEVSELPTLPVAQLKRAAEQLRSELSAAASAPYTGVSDAMRCSAAASALSGALDRTELVEAVRGGMQLLPSFSLDCQALVVHDSPPDTDKASVAASPLENGSHRCFVQHEPSRQWFELADLHVQEAMAQSLAVAQACILIYKRMPGRTLLRPAGSGVPAASDASMEGGGAAGAGEGASVESGV